MQLSRRSLLGAGLGVAATVGLVGCGGSGAGGSTEGGFSAGRAAELPTYIPYEQVTPDLAGNESGLPNAYFTYPENPVQREGFPLEAASAPVAGLFQGMSVVNGRDKNPWWQQHEKATGATWDLQSTISAQWNDKQSVVLAGQDLPDLMMLTKTPQFPALLDKLFVNLSDFLAGDKIADYPGLASISTATWREATLNGSIYGIPNPRVPIGNIVSTRGDLLAERGIDASPTLNSGEDLMDLFKELSNSKENRFAMGALPSSWALSAAREMTGTPNNWREEGGRFTHMYETEEFLAALEVTVEMWKAGVLHPESFTGSNIEWWTGGVTSVYIQNVAGWSQFATSNPDWNVGIIRLPKWDGGGPAPKLLGVAAHGAPVAIKKADDDRVVELLKMIDYIASPFGTREFLEVNFGVKDRDYSMEGTEPKPNTDVTKADQLPGVVYAGGQRSGSLYVPGKPEVVKEQHQVFSEMLADPSTNPASGLYSESEASKANAPNAKLQDLIGEIIQGRQQLTAWKPAVDTWVADVGDAMRNEYAEAFAASK